MSRESKVSCSTASRALDGDADALRASAPSLNHQSRAQSTLPQAECACPMNASGVPEADAHAPQVLSNGWAGALNGTGSNAMANRGNNDPLTVLSNIRNDDIFDDSDTLGALPSSARAEHFSPAINSQVNWKYDLHVVNGENITTTRYAFYSV